jgi:hypothetical protein
MTDHTTGAEATPMTGKSKNRAADASRLTGDIGRAAESIGRAVATWGVWADDVRQDVEHRHGVAYEPDDPAVLGDQEYGCALDIAEHLEDVKRQLDVLAARFAHVGREHDKANCPERRPL